VSSEYKLKSVNNEILSAKRVQDLQNNVKKEIKFFEDEGIKRGNLNLASSIALQQHHPVKWLLKH
jgi:hypothetical protein